MATDKWLTTIGEFTQNLFWAIGYFFGFTVVMVLTVGVLVPGSFDEIFQPGRRPWRFIRQREGKWILAAEAVATIGWLALGCANAVWILTLR